MTYPVSNNNYAIGTGSNSTNVFINVLMERDPTINDIQYPILKRWVNTANGSEYILTSLYVSNGTTFADWIPLAGSTLTYPPIYYTLASTGTSLYGIAPGDAGQVLTSNGNGEYPTFQTIESSELVMGEFGDSPNANAGTIATGTLTLQPCDATNPGGISTGAQVIPGVKTFADAPILTPLTGVLIGNGASAVTANTVTEFNTLVGGSSNTIVSIAPGDVGQVLTSTGPSGNPSYQTIPSNTLTMGMFGGTPNANAGTISSNVLTLQACDGLNPGGISTDAQVIPGVKTFAYLPIVPVSGILIGNNTSQIGATAVTIFNTLVGGAGNTITSIPPGNANQVLTSSGAGMNPRYADIPPNGIVTIDGDSGNVGGGLDTVTITGVDSGPTITFVGSSDHSTLSLKVSDANNNTSIGGNGSATLTGQNNTIVGYSAANLLGGALNNAIYGFSAAENLTTGSNNVLLGAYSGATFTGSESNNININSEGVIGDNNTLRIGQATGSGSGDLNKAFISGINGNTVSNQMYVTIDSMTNQLGTTSGTGGGIDTLNGSTGSATGSTVTLSPGTTGLTYTGATSTITTAGTLNVANGGTGATTLTGVLIGNGTSAVTASTITEYDILSGGASNTINSIALGDIGTVLTSNGAGMQPTFQPPASGGFTSVNIVFLSGSGTYSPSAGTLWIQVELCGGGGAGGAAVSNTAGAATSAGSGGGAGGYCRGTLTAGMYSYGIGSGGTGTGGDGNSGLSTTFSTFTAVGGDGGIATGSSSSRQFVQGGLGGSASGGDVTTNGAPGGAAYTTGFGVGGSGGDSFFSGGGRQIVGTNGAGGGGSFGSGGAGSVGTPSGGGINGADGGDGVIIVTEFIS